MHFDFTQPIILLNFQPQVIIGSLICYLILKLKQVGTMHASNTNIKIKLYLLIPFQLLFMNNRYLRQVEKELEQVMNLKRE